VGALYFSFYLMAMGSGRPRSWPEIRSMLLSAGFRDPVYHRTSVPLVCSVVTASR
jgi:demethylspheroidene O-methyltransferase